MAAVVSLFLVILLLALLWLILRPSPRQRSATQNTRAQSRRLDETRSVRMTEGDNHDPYQHEAVQPERRTGHERRAGVDRRDRIRLEGADRRSGRDRREDSDTWEGHEE